MNRTDGEDEGPFPGSLCHRCAAPPRFIRTGRSTFLFCPILKRYPPQPVLDCAEFVARPPAPDAPPDRVLFAFEGAKGEAAWDAIDDAVMGGRSRSALVVAPGRAAVFTGVVSMENGGGFASVRSADQPLDLSGFSGFRLRVRGDGKRYKLNVRTDARFDGVVYQGGFATSGEWELVAVSFDRLRPTRRGRPAADAGPLDAARVRTLGLAIAEGQAGPFRLEIASIAARA